MRAYRLVGTQNIRRMKAKIQEAGVSTAITKQFETLNDIAAELGVSHSTARNLFTKEPDVIRVGAPGSKRPRYRVPRHVVGTRKAPDVEPATDATSLRSAAECNACVTVDANNAVFATLVNP